MESRAVSFQVEAGEQRHLERSENLAVFKYIQRGRQAC